MKIYALPAVLILLFFPALISAEDQCDLSVTINPEKNSVSGVLKYIPQNSGAISFHTGSLQITNAAELKTQTGIQFTENSKIVIQNLSGSIEISFQGFFPGSDLPYSAEDEISKRGVSLSGIWYPAPEDLCRYSMQADFPENFSAVSEADQIRIEQKENRKLFFFSLNRPMEKATLAASPDFIFRSVQLRDIEISAYFKSENKDLMETYLQNAVQFIKLYEDMFGRYPFKRFAIVENFLPTGYSMPTYTLIGSKVIRLPFIPDTSLGHEILHQWFGNSLYVDESEGNWSEGLTTYLSDHFYEDMEKRGNAYRKNQLLDYQTYVDSSSDYSPSHFIYRKSDADRAIGYGKVSLFFHMLKNLTGEKKFLEALRHLIKTKSFRKVSYTDIKNSFEKTAEMNLDRFFKSWIDSEGTAEVRLDRIRTVPYEKGYRVSFVLNQESKNIYSFPVYLSFYGENGRTEYRFLVTRRSERFSVYLKHSPHRITIDEGYHIPRKLYGKEIPMRIADMFSSRKLYIIAQEDRKETYQVVFDTFPGAEIIDPEKVQSSHLKENCIVLDYKNPFLYRLLDLPRYEYKGSAFFVRNNPLAPGKYFAYIHADSKENLVTDLRRARHYGKYSDVVFENQGMPQIKTLYKTQSGIAYHPGGAADDLIPWAGPAEDLPAEYYSGKIILIGEQHNILKHHENQLELIKKIYSKKKGKMILGMEMFPVDTQEILDLYTSGKITEKEFLLRSEYFKVWGYDYRLYREIMKFVHQKKVKIIAVNQRPDLVKKVARTGVESLSEEEKKLIPSGMDLSNNEYRQRLKEVFERHNFNGAMKFENFYTAQILWDETMAENLYRSFLKNQDHTVVLVAGNGHLKAGHGIPDRFFRRAKIKATVILQDETVKPNEADAVLFNTR
ncbi:MAG: ChaN family lipoprotein, partial [Spirochaetia bacterium]|nr:ChaN family lipoprotein [Spirochaetia bacterium]